MYNAYFKTDKMSGFVPLCKKVSFREAKAWADDKLSQYSKSNCRSIQVMVCDQTGRAQWGTTVDFGF